MCTDVPSLTVCPTCLGEVEDIVILFFKIFVLINEQLIFNSLAFPQYFEFVSEESWLVPLHILDL